MVSRIIGLFVGLKEKLIIGGLIFLAILGYIFKIKRKAYKEGQESVNTQIKKENKEIRDDWEKIDRKPTTVDDAISRLRKRSSREGHSP